MNSKFIYGKDSTERIVSIEVKDKDIHVYRESKEGVVCYVQSNSYWALCARDYVPSCISLGGNLHYRYGVKFNSQTEFRKFTEEARRNNWDIHVAWNPKEMVMLKTGITYYKGMKVEDVSVLSFDIETTSLDPDTGRVLLISNTFRKSGVTTRRLFSYEDYESQKELVNAWCQYVREVDPSILLGHNIYNFDLPYLRNKAQGSLQLGREDKPAIFATRPSKFRKDGSQSYDYCNVLVPGREVVDTFHLAIKFDVARNYPSYKLKEIIDHEGLAVKGRQFYDAALIKNNFDKPDEWVKIKKYAEHDADDALALYDLMIPSYFYFTQHIPKTLQQVINGASGSQVDAFMKRSYLQEGHSLPKSTEAEHFQGATSFGNPGLYKNVNKVDVASLYPSIILKEKLYDKNKDPKGYFLEMVSHFTNERLRNKKAAKETGERHYRDLEQSQKIIINSAYGFLGASGLLFNAPILAASVTKTGREILNRGLKWAETQGYKIVNADTDSFCYSTGRKLSSEDFDKHIEVLNKMDEGIRWENDGQYKAVLIVKAKNYVLDDGKKLKIKGSSLKATMKEPALKEFIGEVIEKLIKDRKDELYDTYMGYVNRISSLGLRDMAQWCSKKTITKAVLNPKRTNESRITDAIGGHHVEEGDKIFVFFETAEKITRLEDFKGVYCKKTLFKKLYKSMEIFDNLVGIDVFPNFALKRNEGRLCDKSEIRQNIRAV